MNIYEQHLLTMRPYTDEMFPTIYSTISRQSFFAFTNTTTQSYFPWYIHHVEQELHEHRNTDH